MINVKLVMDEEHHLIQMTLKGHAGQADHGYDIVCASASILAYTVAQIVKAMEQHGDLLGEPTIELNEGDARILCRCREADVFGELVHTFFVAHVGYLLLAHNYPEFVSLESVW